MRESTVYDLFETVVLAEITELNGNITEGGLNMMIMKEIVSDRTHEKELECGKNMVSCIMDSEEDSEKEVKNGAYVYNAYNKEGLLFNRHNTIADAVREAVMMINAIVICNGKSIIYDTIDNETAYYLDDEDNKVKVVKL